MQRMGGTILKNTGGRLERGAGSNGNSTAEAIGQRVVVPFLFRNEQLLTAASSKKGSIASGSLKISSLEFKRGRAQLLQRNASDRFEHQGQVGAVTLQEAFRLRDNPFGPYDVPGVKPVYAQSLESWPLQIDKAPMLNALFQESVVFEQLTEFRALINAGLRKSIPFLIRGPQGSGKTTLASKMIFELRGQLPPDPTVKVYDKWTFQNFPTAERQITAMSDIEGAIIEDNPDRAFLLMDNILAGAEMEALNMLGRVAESTFLYLFLVTSDPALFATRWDNHWANVRVFDVAPPNPDVAIAYVRERIAPYRIDGEYGGSVYPFDADDIRSMLARRREGGRDLVVLRQINTLLFDALAKGKDISPAHRPLLLAPAYERLVA